MDQKRVSDVPSTVAEASQMVPHYKADVKHDDSRSEATSSDSEPGDAADPGGEQKVGSPWVRPGPRRRRGEADKEAAMAKEESEEKDSAKAKDEKLVKRAPVQVDRVAIDSIPDLDEEAADALVTGGATDAPEERAIREKTLPKWDELREAAGPTRYAGIAVGWCE
eukprot:scaffold529_cov308-Pinguiococcus_pyrenoidosus.AAC.46